MFSSKSMAWLVLTIVGCAAAPVLGQELKVLDQPSWILPGQTFRVAIQQPAGAGKLDVDALSTVKLFDQWDKDSIQRFYFRALSPGDATLSFQGKAGRLRVPLEVTAWTDILRPREHQGLALPRIWPLGDSEYGELKKRRTLHSDEELAALRRPEARVQGMARQWAESSDDEIYDIIPGPATPRTCLIVLGGGGREDGRGKGCPKCGMKVYEGRSAFYPWIFDDKSHPWKVGCPSCNSWFPSNDWRNGDMHSGPFPDDGFGCEPVDPILSPSGVPWRWPFIAYYHQSQAYMNVFTPGIEQCARAFAATGDRRCAHKAAVGLFRYAESMLDMALNLQHRKMACRDAILRWPVGAPQARSELAGTFLYIQPNWDTPRMERCARAWDLIFDQVDQDPELIEFCQRRGHPEIKTPEDFRRFVEAGVIRVPLQACCDNAISRNYPMQEAAAATMAVVMDSPRSLDVIDWLLHDGAGMRFALSNQFFKDGSAFESESYNSIHVRDLDRIFGLMERARALYPDAWRKRGFGSLYDDPKFRRLYDFPIENSLIGRTTTWTGDTGCAVTTAPRRLGQGYPLDPESFAGVYQRTRDPRFAQTLFGPDSRAPSTLTDPELREEVERTGKSRGWQVELASNLLDGYGHAILRSGAGDDQRAFWLRYGRIRQHAHEDLLSMGLAALRRDMLPELGYPQGWTYASDWEANWGVHYGAHITGVNSRDFARGHLTLFADASPARAASAMSSYAAGGEEGMRSRTIALVDLSPQDCYAVTVERVLGGKVHTWSFHGPEGAAAPIDLKLEAQNRGTVLGPEVEYGDVASLPDGDRELACLAFLYDVRRGRPAGMWGLDYLLKDQTDVHLRMTTLGPPGCELAIAQGRPPQGRKTYEMTWAVLRRSGGAPLASQFVTVLEPFQGERRIRRVEPLDLSTAAAGGQPSADRQDAFEPIGVRVASGEFVDTIIFQTEHIAKCMTADGIACRGEFGFWRERDGKRIAAVLAGGDQLGRKGAEIASSQPAYRGRIVSCDWPRRTLVVAPAETAADKAAAPLPGRHLQISNRRGNHASYLIQEAEPQAEGWKITLPLDPRVGEGHVGKCEDGVVTSATRLNLAGLWRYYAGKTISNEDGSAVYRLDDVEDAAKCILDQGSQGKISGRRLSAEFTDRDGDGRPRFLIYDYGPGDEVTIKNCIAAGP